MSAGDRFAEVTGAQVAHTVLEALDEVPWERLESALGDHPPEAMRRVLRNLVLKGGAATEEDCYPLFDCCALGTGRVASAATAALPFVVALARDREVGARVILVELLTGPAEAAAGAGPGRVDADWDEAWRRQRPGFRALLADPVPRGAPTGRSRGCPRSRTCWSRCGRTRRSCCPQCGNCCAPTVRAAR